MKWDAAGRLLELAIGFVTAAASVVLACVALLALQEARRKRLVVPAPGNLRGELFDNLPDKRKVHLSWDPPARSADMIREIVVLRWSNQGQQHWGVMESIMELPPARFYNAEACKKLPEAAPLVCIYRVRVIASNGRKGELSRRVICTSEKCGYVPDEEWPTV